MNPFATSFGLRQTALAAAGGLLLAAAAVPAADLLDEPGLAREGSGWFVRFGARALFNVQASVDRVPKAVRPGVYDNGFVLPDKSGPESQRTWNWGYQDEDQIAGGQVWMNRLAGSPMAGVFDGETDNPSVGPEIIAGNELIRFEIGDRIARVGFEAGYAFHPFSVRDHSTANSTATLYSDAFNLGDTIPPSAPYSGSFEGPGPLLDLEPAVSASISSPSQARFSGEIESSLHNLKFGFWLEYPLARRATLQGSLGLASIYADTQLKYSQSIDFADSRIPDQVLNDETVGGRDWQGGGYLQIRYHHTFNRHMGAYLGAELEYLENLQFKGDGREVTLDFGPLMAVSGGLSIRF